MDKRKEERKEENEENRITIEKKKEKKRRKTTEGNGKRRKENKNKSEKRKTHICFIHFIFQTFSEIDRVDFEKQILSICFSSLIHSTFHVWKKKAKGKLKERKTKNKERK